MARRGRGRPRKPENPVPDFLAGMKHENLSWGADPWLPNRTPASNKGNMNLLAGQLWVPVETAMEFLGVGRRAVQTAMKRGKLTWKTTPTGRLISTESLRKP
jgi:hypothetical protein